jgi:hypothetical protein
MGLFKSLKGEGPKSIGGEDESQDQQQRSSEKRRLFGHSSSSWQALTSTAGAS